MSLTNKLRFCVGHSIDYHNLVPNSHWVQKLGGVNFKVEYQIVAHSDGDIILHTISEAILGALGLGDLGEWFSDTNHDNKNLDSLDILRFVLHQCHERGYTVGNIDVSIVCDAINFQDKKAKIKEFLSNFMQSNINIKATRFEQNSVSKIKCYCVCLLVCN